MLSARNHERWYVCSGPGATYFSLCVQLENMKGGMSVRGQVKYVSQYVVSQENHVK
jgi:hypothetical protein